MQVITTAIMKGGSGKSTTAAALAQAAAANKKRVLCIDTDPQANLSSFIGADPNRPGTFQLIQGDDPAQLIQGTGQGIDVIAASPDLATIRTSKGSAKRLQQAIEPLKGRYSYIFIDTPSKPGELVYNALQACTGLVIPMETDESNLQGLYNIMDIANHIKESNPELSIIGTVLTRFNSQTNYDKFIRGVIQEKGGEIGAPLLGAIRTGIVVKESHGFKQSLYEYAPRSNPAADYMEIYRKIEKRKN